MRIQLIDHQVDSSCTGVYANEQCINEGDAVSPPWTFGGRYDSLPRHGLEAREQTVDAVSFVPFAHSVAKGQCKKRRSLS